GWIDPVCGWGRCVFSPAAPVERSQGEGLRGCPPNRLRRFSPFIPLRPSPCPRPTSWAREAGVTPSGQGGDLLACDLLACDLLACDLLACDHRCGSRALGALRSGIKGEDRRSRSGGQPRSRAPCVRVPPRGSGTPTRGAPGSGNQRSEVSSLR